MLLRKFDFLCQVQRKDSSDRFRFKGEILEMSVIAFSQITVAIR